MLSDRDFYRLNLLLKDKSVCFDDYAENRRYGVIRLLHRQGDIEVRIDDYSTIFCESQYVWFDWPGGEIALSIVIESLLS